MTNVVIVAIAVLVFIAILLLSQFLYWSYVSREQVRARDLARRLGTPLPDQEDPLLIQLSTTGQRGRESELEVLIRQAGSPYDLQSLYFRIGISATVGALVGLFMIKNPIALIGLGLGYVPLLILRFQASSRSKRFSEQLPDALDLLARSLQAGHGISESMRMVAEEFQVPLGPEFGRVYEENNLGRDFRDCFQNLVKRNPGNFDLQIFVGSVLLQRDTGGNLVEILQNISKTIRSRFLFQGKVAALTSEARFTALILGALPFVVSLLLMAMQPEYLTPLWTDPLGRILLGYCITSFSLGVYIMRELSQVEA